MRRSMWAIVAGLVLAVLGAAAVAKIFALPLAELQAGERPIWHLLRTALPVAAFALPGALTAILLSEARRVRGLLYWMTVGAILGLLAHITLTSGDVSRVAAFQTTRSFNILMGMGLGGGFLYWLIAGHGAGLMANAVDRASRDSNLDERGLRKRCRACSIGTIMLGLLPLGLIGWHAIYKPVPALQEALAAQAAAEGTRTLSDEGMPWAKLAIEDHVGRIAGVAPDADARTKGFEKAKMALAPMIGLPGVVAYLQNDLTVAETAKPAASGAAVAAVSPTKPANVPEKIKPAEELRLAVEAKRKVDEAAAKAKAEDEARIAAETKRKAEEAAAKAKAEDEARVAAETKRKAEEAAAKAKAEDEARVAAEMKRKAEEAAAKAKAEEEARVAAETKRQADEAAAKAKAEEEARVTAEAKRKADEAAAKAKADEAARVAAAAVVAVPAPQAPATNATAPTASAPAAVAPQNGPAATGGATEAACIADFSDAFRASSIRFGFKSDALDDNALESIERYAGIAKKCGNFALTIGGHADRTGPADVNKAVSLNRANIVRNALLARGIAGDRLRAEGYGSQRPFDLAKTRAANRLNRRVEIAASVTPPGALAAPVTPVPTASRPEPVAVLPAEQCNAEFSRAFSNDTIRFIGASAIVADSYAEFLDHLARLALACPTHKIAIGGHTDRRGSAAFNDTLSVERAQAVRDALIDRDVPEARLTANGYGGQRPFDPGNTPAAYALNRRVDFGVSISTPKSQ